MHFIVNSIVHQFYRRGTSLVLSPCLSHNHKHIFAYVCRTPWGSTPLIRISPKKDGQGVCRRLGLYHRHRRGIRLHTDAVQVHDLSSYSVSRKHCTLAGMWYRTSEYLRGQAWIVNPIRSLPDANSSPAIFHLSNYFESQILLPSLQFNSTLSFSRYLHLSLLCLEDSFKIKDCGDSIPGHGGMTDCMDCQFMMVFFSREI